MPHDSSNCTAWSFLLLHKKIYARPVGALALRSSEVSHRHAVRRGSVAVIVGGAFAGIASAGWLSEVFDKVVVLERDIVPTAETDALRLLQDLSAPNASIQARQPIDRFLFWFFNQLWRDGCMSLHTRACRGCISAHRPAAAVSQDPLSGGVTAVGVWQTGHVLLDINSSLCFCRSAYPQAWTT